MYFLTGRPGVGKTSVILGIIEIIKGRGCRVGGMVSQETRVGGSRVGFEVCNIRTGETGCLAHVNQLEGPRVSRYRVDLIGLNSVGVEAIMDAIESSDVIVIDEIGPMELHSSAFKEAVVKGMESHKPVLGTVHYRAMDPLIRMIRGHEGAEIIEVTEENRDRLPNDVSKRILELLDT